MSLSLGSDPELIFTDSSGLLVGANSVLSGGTNAPFGCDGASSIAELRPGVAQTPRTMVHQLQSLMRQELETNSQLASINWWAGNQVCGRDIGGHIHLGGDFAQSSSGRDSIVRGLDQILSPIVILVEDADQARARRSGGYGQLGAYEGKSYGFEYRTPASWLVSKGAALAVLSIAHAVAQTAESRGDDWDLTQSDQRFLSDMSSSRFREADKDYFQSRFQRTWKILGRFQKAREYWPEISYLRQLIQSGRTWHNGQDIKARWRLSSPPEQVDSGTRDSSQIPVMTPEQAWSFVSDSRNA